MIKSDPILEQDILIAQYTLGLLSTQETHRVQQLLSRDSLAARKALHWEEVFLTLADALPTTSPPAKVLEQILIALDLPMPTAQDSTQASDGQPTAAHPDPCSTPTDRTQSLPTARGELSEPTIALNPDLTFRKESNTEPSGGTVSPQNEPTLKPVTATPDDSTGRHQAMMHKRRLRSRKIWLGGATAAVLMALLTLAFVPRRAAEPPVVIVEVAPTKGAILQAPGQSSTPGWVVTIDLENNVTLTPQVHTDTPADTSVQLWTYNKTLRQPRSLGLIDPNLPVAIPAELMGEIGEEQFFEMTLEPVGGSPIAEPTGPILFIGRVVTFS